MWYTYIIQSEKDKSLYIGSTNDLRKRFAQHNLQKSIFTKKKMPYKLVYYEAYLTQKQARMRERMLKYFGTTYHQLKKQILPKG